MKKGYKIICFMVSLLFIGLFSCKVSAKSIQEHSSILQEISDISNDLKLFVNSNEDISCFNCVREYKGYRDSYIFVYDDADKARKDYDIFNDLEIVSNVYYDSYLQLSLYKDKVFDRYYSDGAIDSGVMDFHNTLLSIDNNLNNYEEIVVAVIDTGIDTSHEWFKDRLLLEYAKDVTKPEGAQIIDTQGHGTHVAGIIVDLTLPNVKILPIKVFQDGAKITNVTQVSLALEYIMDLKINKGINIVAINLSISGLANVNTKKAYDEIFTRVRANNIISISSSGNNNSSSVCDYYPGSASNVLNIGSIYKDVDTFKKSAFSNYGSATCLDYVSFGEEIESARMNGGTISYNGTSMAAPHVSALIANLYTSNPRYSVNEVLTHLEDNALDLGELGKDNYYGFGLARIGINTSETLPALDVSNKNFNIDFSVNSIVTRILSSSDIDVIYYTLDGSIPKIGSINTIKYNDEDIFIETSLQLKAIGYKFKNKLLAEKTPLLQVNYVFLGSDIDSNYRVNFKGELVEYMGNFENLRIPAYINGVKVVGIANICNKIGASFGVKKLYIDKGIDTILNGAFYDCESIEYVDARYVKYLQTNAFNMSINLKDIVLRDVISIGKYALANLNIEKSLVLDNVISVDDYAFSDSKFTNISLINALSVGKYAFLRTTNLNEVRLDNALTILDNAFKESLLTNININNVEVLGNNVFEGATRLNKLDIPKITSLGNEINKSSLIKKIYTGQSLNSVSENSIVKTSGLEVYVYTGCPLINYLISNQITYHIVDEFKIVNELKECYYLNKYLNENSVRLQIFALGESLKYTWYKQIGNEKVKIDNQINNYLDVSETSLDIYYYVEIKNKDNIVLNSVRARVLPYYKINLVNEDSKVLLETNVYYIKHGDNFEFKFDVLDRYKIRTIAINNIYENVYDNSISLTNINRDYNIEIFTILTSKPILTINYIYLNETSKNSVEKKQVDLGLNDIVIKVNYGYKICSIDLHEQGEGYVNYNCDNKFNGLNEYVLENINIDNDYMINVNFISSVKVIDFIIFGNGRINHDVQILKNTGESIEALQVSADVGYHLEYITCNGLEVSLDKLNVYFKSIKDNMHIIISFVINTYNVSFISDDKVIYREKVNHGEMPKYNGIPFKESDSIYSYTFSGWDKKITNIEADTTYYATYKTTNLEYNVNFKIYGYASINLSLNNRVKSLTDLSNLEINCEPHYHVSQIKINNSYYSELELYKRLKDIRYDMNVEILTEENKYLIRFLNDDHSIILQGYYKHNDKINVPDDIYKSSDSNYLYKFIGWDKEITNPSKDIDYIALYEKVKIVVDDKKGKTGLSCSKNKTSESNYTDLLLCISILGLIAIKRKYI